MAKPNDGFIALKKYAGRMLFHSDATGPFWSIGVNAFMDTWENDPLAAVVAKSDYKTVYENELQRITQQGFNTLSGWSKIAPLRDQIPFGVMLFDDDEMPTVDPLVNVKGKEVPQGASHTPSPVRDPYSKRYQEALDKYIREKVSPWRDARMLLCYWLSHESGLGDSDPIDFSEYLYSEGVQSRLKEWLKEKHKAKPTKKDLREFAALVVSDWFALVVRTIKKYDPDHLISSPKLSAYDHQGYLHRPLDLGHFESFRGHFDLLSVDMYAADEEYPAGLINDLRGISFMLGLPVLVAEFGTRQKMDGWTNTPGAPKFVANQQERAERYRSQVMQLFGEPWIVGAHWFKWGDRFSQSHQMNQGMVTVNGGTITPYAELVDGMRRVHLDIQGHVQKLQNQNRMLISIANNASTDCRRSMAAGFSSSDKTFFTWSGANMRPQVAQCDNATSQCKIKDLGPINSHGGYYDFHDYSHLVRAKDRRLIVVYSNHNRQLWQLRSPMADSIDGEWTKTEIKGAGGKSIRATYPMPIVTRAGTIYIFYRKTTDVPDNRPIAYVKSTDHGLAWKDPQPAIDFQNKRQDHLNEIYIGRMIYEESSNKILMSWTLAGGGLFKHAHDVYHKDVYFAYFDPGTERFSSASGKDLGAHIDNEEASRFCLVYDSGSLDQAMKQHIDYRPLVQRDPRTGKPLVMFYNEAKDQAMLARWDGAAWQITETAFFARELVATSEGNLRAVAAKRDEVQLYESVDGGASWHIARTIPTPHKFDRIISIDGAGNRLFGQHTIKEDEATDATAGGSSVYQIVLP